MPTGMTEAIRACLMEEMRLDVISNNLANVSAPGFKKYRISFEKALEDAQGGDSPSTLQVGSTVVRTEVDFNQGDVRQTGNSLDLAIHGTGFFKVQTVDGVRYTRKGNFALDPGNYLITADGDRVLGDGGPLQVPAGEVKFGPGGAVSVNDQEIGRIALVDFENPHVLLPEGGALFANPNNAPESPADPRSTVNQGYIENANVDISEEMVSMIHCMRAFESYQKAIKILDDLNGRAINDVGRVR